MSFDIESLKDKSNERIYNLCLQNIKNELKEKRNSYIEDLLIKNAIDGIGIDYCMSYMQTFIKSPWKDLEEILLRDKEKLKERKKEFFLVLQYSIYSKKRNDCVEKEILKDVPGEFLEVYYYKYASVYSILFPDFFADLIGHRKYNLIGFMDDYISSIPISSEDRWFYFFNFILYDRKSELYKNFNMIKTKYSHFFNMLISGINK